MSLKPLVLTLALRQSLSALEEGLGGREAMAALLAVAPGTDLAYVAGLLGDPSHAHESLAEVCALGGISPKELLRHFKDAELYRAQLLSVHHVAQRLPEVTRDVMIRALPQEEGCAKCQGTGRLDGTPCPECLGSGRVRIDPSLDRQKLALELGGLVTKGGPAIQILNQQQVAVGVPGALERLQAATDEILYGEVLNADPEIEDAPG